MKAEPTLSLASRRRVMVLVLFGVIVMTVMAVKSFNDGWFEPQTPLVLNNQPALLFFTLGHGCECQMLVIRNAEAQLAAWTVVLDNQITVLQVDFGRRPDLVRQYGVRRAPALVLLNGDGELVWKQDVGLSDGAPLDLIAAEAYILPVGENLP